MSEAERWSRVSEILSRALDLPKVERTGFLAQAIREEPELRTEVLAMLEEVGASEDFLEGPATGEVVSAGEFGPYRVVRELGEGGMGIVYLAERGDGQFTRCVAIKRIGSAVPSVDMLRRFGDEKQILARLDHPNIARLLDAGLDAAGVPYLVMEHVEGAPITSFCRERHLAVRDRLALFLKVCAAVQHAHQNLVVHRDIKPGNILVTPSGEPKLLDFGIARLGDEAVSAEMTRTANRALTLDFASPEQVRGDPVNVSTDVYSLGVVLYQLLADRKPYDVGGTSLGEAVRIVCEFVPPPPSQTAPVERRGELEGDLDSIVRKAMEKSPTERYATIAHLVTDITAHLDHRPVGARRHSFAYRARKFVRRHRVGTAVAAGGLALLLAASSVVLWQARVAENERARAQKRFDEVREIASYVIFDLQDALSNLTGTTELRRNMVERSLAYLDSLAADAAGDSGLETELARAYVRLGDVLGRHNVANLGDREGALASYRKARELLEHVLSRKPGDADTRRHLARLLLNLHTSLESDERDLAAEALADSMAIWEELVGEDPENEDNLRGLASAHFSAFGEPLGEPGAALRHMERALELFQRLLEARPQDLDRKRNVALCHKNLAAVLVTHEPERAHEHAVEAARLDLERLSAEPENARAKLDYTFDLSQLGSYHLERGEFPEALRHFERALALRRELWEADSANVYARRRVAYMLMKVGESHVLTGNHGVALPLLQEAIELGGDDVDPRTLLGSYLLLGEVELASKKDPCPSYRRMAERLPHWDATRHELGTELERMRERALDSLKSCAE